MTEKQNLNLAINFDDYSEQLFYLSFKHPKAHTVLWFLINDMNENNISKATQKEMIDHFKKSRQTISNALRDLEDLDLLKNPNMPHPIFITSTKKHF